MDAGEAAVERGGLGFDERDGDAGVGEAHGDAAAHGAGADDGGAGDGAGLGAEGQLGLLGLAFGEEGVALGAAFVAIEELDEEAAFVGEAFVEWEGDGAADGFDAVAGGLGAGGFEEGGGEPVDEGGVVAGGLEGVVAVAHPAVREVWGCCGPRRWRRRGTRLRGWRR